MTKPALTRQMKKTDNLIEVVGELYKWRKRIFQICIGTAIIAACIALLMPNYYKATTTFYAASPDLTKPEKIFGYSSYDMNYYGSGLDIDRLLTIGFSNELAEFLIDSFNLYEHYDIDSTTEKAKHKIKTALTKLYNVTKTKHDAIELSIEDKDRYVAAQMTNAARNKINELAQKVIKRSQLSVIETFENSTKEKYRQLELLGDSLQFLQRKYGIFSTESQSEFLSEILSSTESKLIKERERLAILKETPGIPRDTIRLLNATVKSLEKEYKSLTDPESESLNSFNKFTQGKSLIETLQQIYGQLYRQLSYDNVRLEQLRSAYDANVTTVHLVETADIPVVKSRPKRTLLVLGAVMIAFILSCLAILLYETWRNNSWEEAFKD